MTASDVEADARPPRSNSRFPGAVTTLAIVTVLVWVAALFIPSGRYLTDVDGSPIPGTFEQVPSPLSFSETVEQLILAPVNGVYGLRNAETEFVSTETVGRIFGQIGVIVFIMSIGAFISVSFATRALEVAVASLAHRLRDKGWLLIATVMVLFSLLGSTMGFSVETLGFYALFLPLMAALGYDRLVTASMIILGALIGVMAATVNPFSIGVAAGEAGVSIGDGIGLRAVLWVVLTAMSVGWVLRYAAKVRKDPAASLVGWEEDTRADEPAAASDGDHKSAAPGTQERLTGTQKAVLAITGFAFGLMIFSVIPWSSVIDARPALADYYATHEVAGAQPFWFELNWWFPQLGHAVHPGFGAGGLRREDGREGDRAADRRRRRRHDGPGHGGAAGRRRVGDHDQHADAGHHPALDGKAGQRHVGGLLHHADGAGEHSAGLPDPVQLGPRRAGHAAAGAAGRLCRRSAAPPPSPRGSWATAWR